MKKLMLIPLIFLALTAPLLNGCSGAKVDENNPQELYKDAEEDISDSRYTMALDKLKNLKNRFPYSHLATLAQLRIGDVYFLEESFIEAAGAYESFRDMHPKHDKADYVLFRIGESYYNQLPSTNDRDLTPANKAIEAYQELIGLFPKSQHLAEAKDHLKISHERLSAKERYIADFYYKRDQFDSAATRYEKITARFPGSSVEQYAYWRWAQSLVRQAKLDEAKHVYRVYVSRFPSGSYAPAARKWLEDPKHAMSAEEAEAQAEAAKEPR